MKEFSTDIAIIGAGVGGVAAALGALRSGRRVILSEEFDWIGGQLVSQAVPSDEHSWIEHFGGSRTYRELRTAVRQYYRDHYPLNESARQWADLNPGAGWVSRLCVEPRVILAVMEALLMPYIGSGKLQLLKPWKPVSTEMDGDRVRAVTLRHVLSSEQATIAASYVIDATEFGDLLPLTGTDYVTGFESQSETGEPSAPPEAQPQNQQAVSICFAMDHVDGNHVIDKPKNYDYWRKVQPDFWGGPLIGLKSPNPRTLEISERTITPNPDDDPLLVDADQRKNPGDGNLWTFRRIAARRNFVEGAYESDICLVNWPMLDYFEKPVIDCTEAEYQTRIGRAAELSLAVFYWMQTDVPRADGGQGYPGLRLRGDVTGTEHGLAMAPYVRESRRIKAITTIVEQDLSHTVRGDAGAVNYRDSVGTGMYRIDLHPSTGGDNYIDVPSCPFELPLGALLPVNRSNLLPAGKNIGTTHITNGCYRLHPVEWNIGEVVGLLAAHCLNKGTTPHAVQSDDNQLRDFQSLLYWNGVEIRWPDIRGY